MSGVAPTESWAQCVLSEGIVLSEGLVLSEGPVLSEIDLLAYSASGDGIVVGE